MTKNRLGKPCRLPRKAKKLMALQCGDSEYLTQCNFIRMGVLIDFVHLK